MGVIPDVRLFGKLNNILSEDPTTAAADAGSIEIALCGYGSQVPHVPSQAMLSQVTQGLGVTVNAIDQGTFTAYLFSNPLILPDGTYYTITVRNFNGDVVQVNAYRFTAGGSFDLDALTPYDPNQPPPPLPPLILNLLLIVPYTSAPDFPGDTYTSWQITLNGDATATFSNLVDGNLYTIIIVQDGSGDHNFIWPLNAYNPTLVNQEPSAMTVQTFVAVSNMLYPIGAGTYYP